MPLQYVGMKHMETQAIDRELKKGSAALLILSLIEHRARHGYEISKLIEERSEGMLKFNVASFYPLLYRLEARGLIAGRWFEKAGQRRRRYYRLTTQGKEMLKSQRSTWVNLVNAIRLVTEAENA
jgi:PadR family transcriptional regulator, regulatory protein PadR